MYCRRPQCTTVLPRVRPPPRGAPSSMPRHQRHQILSVDAAPSTPPNPRSDPVARSQESLRRRPAIIAPCAVLMSPPSSPCSPAHHPLPLAPEGITDHPDSPSIWARDRPRHPRHAPRHPLPSAPDGLRDGRPRLTHQIPLSHPAYPSTIRPRPSNPAPTGPGEDGTPAPPRDPRVDSRAVAAPDCESYRPLGDVLVINDNCLWANDSWRNKNAGLDHIEQKILEIHKHWLWIK
jgi:hypothetical protein